MEEVLENFTEEEKHSLELISKWGYDGSQQSQFKQIFQSNKHSEVIQFMEKQVSNLNKTDIQAVGF